MMVNHSSRPQVSYIFKQESSPFELITCAVRQNVSTPSISGWPDKKSIHLLVLGIQFYLFDHQPRKTEEILCTKYTCNTPVWARNAKILAMHATVFSLLIGLELIALSISIALKHASVTLTVGCGTACFKLSSFGNLGYIVL